MIGAFPIRFYKHFSLHSNKNKKRAAKEQFYYTNSLFILINPLFIPTNTHKAPINWNVKSISAAGETQTNESFITKKNAYTAITSGTIPYPDNKA